MKLGSGKRKTNKRSSNGKAINVALCGIGGVGKTETAFAILSMSDEAQQVPSPGNTITTIGLVTYPIKIDGRQVKIYDLGGQDGFRDIINGILYHIDIAIIVVDITQTSDFEVIEKYVCTDLALNADKTDAELEKMENVSTAFGASGKNKLPSSSIIVVVGNKRDLVDSDEELQKNIKKMVKVIEESAQKTKLKLPVPIKHCIISATDRTNVSELVDIIKSYGRARDEANEKKPSTSFKCPF